IFSALVLCPHKTKKHVTVCLMSAAIFGALGSSFLYGYNLSVVNAPAEFIANFTNKTWLERYGMPIGDETADLLWSVTVSILAIGGLLGAVVVKFLVQILGRRGSLVVNSSFALMAALLLALGERARSFEMLIIGRLIMGVHSGIALSALPMYLGEISPKSSRGFIGQFHGIMINVGVFTGQVLGLPDLLGQESRWNFLFAFIALPALLQLSVLPFLPESPRYLLMERRDEAAAEKGLSRFLGREDVSRELEEVRAESQNNLQVVSVLELLRSPAVRWQVTTVIVTMTCYQLCGLNALFFYTNEILFDAGIEASVVPYIALCTGGIEIISSGLLIERVGRRPLLILGFSGMAVGFSLSVWAPMQVFQHCVFTHVMLSSLPAGGVFILTSELFDQSYRPAAFMIGGTVLWLSNFTVGLVFPFLQALSTYVFLVFAAVCTLAAVYLCLFLPETKNKTFADISQSFAKKKIPLTTARLDGQSLRRLKKKIRSYGCLSHGV
uniref:Solute carrier family 2, facilitated glucose transporter member 5 n=1 Tax=Myripristis murdjan TaxID=586833 RepID=A0A667X5L1_9TELE